MADGDLGGSCTTASLSASLCGFDSHHWRQRNLAARLPLHDLQLPRRHGIWQPHGLGHALVCGSSGVQLCRTFFSSATLYSTTTLNTIKCDESTCGIIVQPS